MGVVAAAITVAAVWSGAWIVSKSAVAYIPPLELSAVRFAIAGVALLLVCRIFRIPLGLQRLRWILLASALGVPGYHALVFIGLTMAPASDAGMIVPTLAPVMTAILATLVGERMTATKLAGFALASAGALLVIVTGSREAGLAGDRRLLGDVLILGGTFCQAAYVVVGWAAIRDRSPVALVTLTSLFGATMLFPLGFLEKGYGDMSSWPAEGWASIAYLAAFATIVGFILFYWAVKRLGPGVGSTISYLVPVTTVLLAFLVLREQPQPLQLVGGAVILAGVRLATLPARAAALTHASA